MQAGRSAALAAAEVVRETRSAYWPTVFGSVTGAVAQDGTRITAGGLNNPNVFDRVGAGVTVSQLVADFGRTGNLVQSQSLRAGAQEDTATRLRAEVLLRVDQAYFDALRAQAVLRVARQTVEARQLVADQVSALAASNLKSGLDVSFARVNLGQAQLLLVQAQSDVDGSFAALGAAIGSPGVRTFDLVEEPMPGPPADDVAPLIAQAFRERPDLAAQQLAKQAAARFASAEHALWYRTVAAVGVAGVTPYHRDNLNDRYAAAGFNVTVPIANGGLNSARRGEAAFRAEMEDEALRDLENRVTRDVTLAWLQAKTGFQRVDLTNQLLAQASDALESHRPATTSGSVPSSETHSGAAEQDAGRDRPGERPLRLPGSNGGAAISDGAAEMRSVVVQAFRPASHRLNALEAARREAREQRAEEHDRHQHERAGPRLAVPVLVGRNRVGVDLHGQRRRSAASELRREEAVVERREEQRRRLAGDARQREHDAGDDARQRRRQHDGEDRARARRAERQRAFAHRAGHEQQQFLGRPRDDRNHHDAEREAAGERAELLERQHGDPVDEHADHDRRHAVQRVGGEPDERREAGARRTPTCRRR